MLLASSASIPTIASAVEEEEYARSEANSVHYDGYVTDHTDLASDIDIDESEYRRELLNDVSDCIISLGAPPLNLRRIHRRSLDRIEINQIGPSVNNRSIDFPRFLLVTVSVFISLRSQSVQL